MEPRVPAAHVLETQISHSSSSTAATATTTTIPLLSGAQLDVRMQLPSDAVLYASILNSFAAQLAIRAAEVVAASSYKPADGRIISASSILRDLEQSVDFWMKRRGGPGQLPGLIPSPRLAQPSASSAPAATTTRLDTAYASIDASLPWYPNVSPRIVDLKNCKFKDCAGKAFAEVCFMYACNMFNQGDYAKLNGMVASAKAEYKLHNGKRANGDAETSADILLCVTRGSAVLVGKKIECKLVGSNKESYQIQVSSRVKNADAYFTVLARGADFKQPRYSDNANARASHLLCPDYVRAFAFVDTRELAGMLSKPYFRINLNKAGVDKVTSLAPKRTAEFATLHLDGRADWPCRDNASNADIMFYELMEWIFKICREAMSTQTTPLRPV